MSVLQSISDAVRELAASAAQWTLAVHGRPQTPSSGVHWTDDVVVTTDHTLRRDDDIYVSSPSGDKLQATIAGRDPGTDLAVLRVPGLGATKVAFMDSASVSQGELVVAAGRGGAVRLGFVTESAGPWRTWRGGVIDRFIAADLPIFMGYSGGALVSASGRVIGINTSGLTRGAGVTVPASTVDRVTGELLKRGRVARGYIGAGVQIVRLPEGGNGLMILSLESGGPAERGGLLLGDVLLSAAGEALRDTDDLQRALTSDRIGRAVPFRILRAGQHIELPVVIGERS